MFGISHIYILYCARLIRNTPIVCIEAVSLQNYANWRGPTKRGPLFRPRRPQWSAGLIFWIITMLTIPRQGKYFGYHRIAHFDRGPGGDNSICLVGERTGWGDGEAVFGKGIKSPPIIGHIQIACCITESGEFLFNLNGPQKFT